MWHWGKAVVCEAGKLACGRVWATCVVCSEIREHEGIELVIMLVKSEQAMAVECAITVLINMSKVEELGDDIVDSGVIPALIQALSFQLVLSFVTLQQHSLDFGSNLLEVMCTVL